MMPERLKRCGGGCFFSKPAHEQLDFFSHLHAPRNGEPIRAISETDRVSYAQRRDELSLLKQQVDER